MLSGSWKYLDLSALCGQIVGVYLFVVQSDLMRPIAAWSVLLSFVKLLSFARGFASSGPLIRMIAKSIVEVSTDQQCSHHPNGSLQAYTILRSTWEYI
jgi:hypothetical protein